MLRCARSMPAAHILYPALRARNTACTLRAHCVRAARCTLHTHTAKVRLAARVLTPYEVAALICDEDDDDDDDDEGDEGDEEGGGARREARSVEIIDVRTATQRTTHQINGRGALTARGARAASLDDMVGGRVALPPPEQLVVLVCSRGPTGLSRVAGLAVPQPATPATWGRLQASWGGLFRPPG